MLRLEKPNETKLIIISNYDYFFILFFAICFDVSHFVNNATLKDTEFSVY